MLLAPGLPVPGVAVPVGAGVPVGVDVAVGVGVADLVGSGTGELVGDALAVGDVGVDGGVDWLGAELLGPDDGEWVTDPGPRP